MWESILSVVLLVVGMGLLIKGADWFVEGAASIAKSLGIPSLVIGLTLVLVHLLGINLTGTSVNPARSLGHAIFMGGEYLKQIFEINIRCLLINADNFAM